MCGTRSLHYPQNKRVRVQKESTDNPLKGLARVLKKKRRNMASKNKKFNVKHMGGNVDREESEQVTKDYEVRLLLCALDDF